MSGSTTPPGWYPAPGDPPGTHRYWNGTEWTTGPQPMQQAGMPPMVGSQGTVHGRPLASPGQRIGARLIDAVIISVALGALVVALFFSGDDDFNQFTGFNIGYTLILLVASAAYEVGFVIWKGGTPGKLVLGLRVIQQEDGRTPPDQQHAFMRWVPTLLGYVPFVGSLISLGISILSLVWLFNDPNRQTVYDKIAKTYVVKV